MVTLSCIKGFGNEVYWLPSCIRYSMEYCIQMVWDLSADVQDQKGPGMAEDLRRYQDSQ